MNVIATASHVEKFASNEQFPRFNKTPREESETVGDCIFHYLIHTW